MLGILRKVSRRLWQERLPESGGAITLPEPNGSGAAGWPLEIRALLVSLRARAYVQNNRRRGQRRAYETQATLWYSPPDQDADRPPRQATIYTRDATARTLAFVTDVHLKPHQNVVIEIASAGPTPPARLQGQVRRCRQFRDGWFDCVVHLSSVSFSRSVIRS
ncbi:MAG TPA: hypothetical protein VNL70_11680 [Tepidisphaeraceae bacterium]|nr:hypothetical protein [Tepidisphaeraceae bacterium]